MEVGQTASYSKTVEERDIQLFAALSGDRNPVHLDAEYAAATMFKERIAHGMFSGALISAAVACELPGPGTIYLGQQMRFTAPVKLGDRLTVRLEILEKLPKFRVRIATRVFNQCDELVVDGEAEILAPRKQQTVQLTELPPISIG
ncbi:MaoC family dehydratase [Pseudomonas lalucatii]|nr:MaoC family dehydratase [Pseudomonas lalucatii]